MDFVYQILGYLAVFFHILQFLSISSRRMLFFGLLSAFLLSMHFMMLGTLNGVLACLISIVVKLVALNNKEALSRLIMRVSPFVSILYFSMVSENFYDVFPSIALFFIMIADLQKSILRMKLIYYGSAISWLMYGLCIQSIPAIMYDIFGIIFLTVGIIRIKKDLVKSM